MIIEDIVFTNAISKEYKFYYCIKMVIKEKLGGVVCIGHIVNNVVSTTKSVIRE
jgi:hypothetical protein